MRGAFLQADPVLVDGSLPLQSLAVLTTMSAMDVLALVAPGLVVAALRATDVLLGVCKTAHVVGGNRGAAALFAGLEGAVWLSAAGIVFAEPTPARALGFVGGIAAGTYIGMALVHALRLGTVTVRVFVSAGTGRELAGHDVALAIRLEGYGATLFEGWGHSGRVDMVLSVVRRREARQVIQAVQRRDSGAFVAVDNLPGPGSVVSGLTGVRP